MIKFYYFRSIVFILKVKNFWNGYGIVKGVLLRCVDLL